MKNKFCLTAFVICMLVCNAYSQTKDSLFLDIRSARKVGIILSYNAEQPPKVLIDASNQVDINPARWILNIKSLTTDVHVFIINTTGDSPDSAELVSLNENYPITNSTLIGTTFKLKDQIKISVYNKAMNKLIKDFNVSFITPGTTLPKNTDPNKGGNLPNAYKIGSPVYDAMALKGNASISIDLKLLILKYYANGKDISDAYKDNKFLKDLVANIKGGTPQGNLDLSSIFSSVGGLDVTTIADGLAKFVVKRAKQELGISFFEKFKTVIDSTKDLKTLFPQTADLLAGINEQVYDYNKYIQNLREAFKEDIDALYLNFPGIINNHEDFFNNHKLLKASVLSACYIAKGLDDQAHPGDILAGYPVEYLDNINNKNYKAGIQTIQLISESLKDTTTGENTAYWANIKQIRQLVYDREAFGYYLGLLYQQVANREAAGDIISYEGITLKSILDKVADEYFKVFTTYDAYKRYILKFGEKVEALNKMIKADTADGTDSAKIEKYAKYFRAAVGIIQYSSEVSQLPIIKTHTVGLDTLLSKYFSISYSVTDMVIDINRKNYSAAINHAIQIYRSIVKDDTKGEVPAFKNYLNSLVKYGSFASTVATAKTSDEVASAIETAALPAGSAKIKRASDFNVSLNAYAGLFFGIERINSVDSGKTKPNVYGVTAPIGIAASWGHRLFFINTGERQWSTSIFISLIDLGAIAAFRFRDDSTAQVPTIKLKDIFSPGAFLSIGIPKTPLSVNLGAQMGPNLRKVNNSDPAKPYNDYGNKIYWRYSISVCVDIPLLNFYTKAK